VKVPVQIGFTAPVLRKRYCLTLEEYREKAMTQVTGFRRLAAVFLSGALVISTMPPVQAQPIPMSRDLGASEQVAQVRYRRGAPPRHGYVRRHRGNGGAAAAAIIGALVLGGAALAASQHSRQRRDYYAYDDYPPPGYGYAPAPNYGYSQGYGYAPGYGYSEPQYHAPRQRGRVAPPADTSSPYAVAPQRAGARNRVQWEQSQPYNPRHRYTNPYTGELLPPGVRPPPMPQ